MAASGSTGFEVLTGDNYERWSVLVRNYLRGEGLWDTVNSDHTNLNDEEWERRDAKALYAIQLSCGPRYFELISDSKNAREAWTRLQSSRSANLKGIPLETGNRTLKYSESLVASNEYFVVGLESQKLNFLVN